MVQVMDPKSLKVLNTKFLNSRVGYRSCSTTFLYLSCNRRNNSIMQQDYYFITQLKNIYLAMIKHD